MKKGRKKYTVAMTGMYGTYIAGIHITETARQAIAKAKKSYGPEKDRWTFYVLKNKK
jgi:hypothetical protein